jgi:hypothetical protein
MVDWLSNAAESGPSLTEDYMITVMRATEQTGRKITESLLKVGEKVRALGRSESKLAEIPRLNPTAINASAGTLSPFVVIVGLLIHLGCETTVISANPRQVIVKSSELDAKESQRLAEAECGKHQRYARMSLKATNIDPNYTFDCVE